MKWLEFNKFNKILESKLEIESNKKPCKSNHAYGYTPVIPNGQCRIWLGYEIKSDKLF